MFNQEEEQVVLPKRTQATPPLQDEAARMKAYYGAYLKKSIASSQNVIDMDNYVINKKPLAYIHKNDMLSDGQTNDVIGYALSGVDANGDIQMRLFPTPSASSKTISVYGIKRTDDLVNDTDTVLVPSNVVVAMAYGTALIERGETGGQSGSEQAFFAKYALSDAIALDAGMHSDELTWTTV